MLWRKNRKAGEMCGDCDILDRVATKGLTEKVAFEPRKTCRRWWRKPCGYLEEEHSGQRHWCGDPEVEMYILVGETGCCSQLSEERRSR